MFCPPISTPEACPVPGAAGAQLTEAPAPTVARQSNACRPSSRTTCGREATGWSAQAASEIEAKMAETTSLPGRAAPGVERYMAFRSRGRGGRGGTQADEIGALILPTRRRGRSSEKITAQQ